MTDFKSKNDAARGAAGGRLSIRTVFASKDAGVDSVYARNRIPGIISTASGALLLVHEARRSWEDWAYIDIIVVRSTDGGKTFERPFYICRGVEDGLTANNAVLIAAGERIHVIYCKKYAVPGVDGSGVFMRTSDDDGCTFGPERDITSATRPDIRNVFATGPGHGIQLFDGTLIVPVWMVLKSAGVEPKEHRPAVVSVLYSLDGGSTFRLGPIIGDTAQAGDFNETSAVQLEDGSVMLNIRTGALRDDTGGYVHPGYCYRSISVSPDGVGGYSAPYLDKNLLDPVCYGSTAAYNIEGLPYGVLFVNCEHPSKRENLVVKLSLDGGRTYPYKRAITTGIAGYADITVAKDGSIYVFYEEDAGLYLKLARFDLDWLTGGAVK